jgi:hypothetical protein
MGILSGCTGKSRRFLRLKNFRDGGGRARLAALEKTV